MNFHIPYVPHRNGAKWSLVTDDSPSGVTSLASGLVFAVGAPEIPGRCCLRTLALKTTSG